MDTRNAAIPILKQELRNCGLHFTLDDSGGMVLSGAGGRPVDRGGGKEADSVKSDGEVV